MNRRRFLTRLAGTLSALITGMVGSRFLEASTIVKPDGKYPSCTALFGETKLTDVKLGKSFMASHPERKRTGMELHLETAFFRKWRDTAPKVSRVVDVEIAIDGLTKEFTFEDFKKRLGFNR